MTSTPTPSSKVSVQGTAFLPWNLGRWREYVLHFLSDIFEYWSRRQTSLRFLLILLGWEAVWKHGHFRELQECAAKVTDIHGTFRNGKLGLFFTKPENLSSSWHTIHHPLSLKNLYWRCNQAAIRLAKVHSRGLPSLLLIYKICCISLCQNTRLYTVQEICQMASARHEMALI